MAQPIHRSYVQQAAIAATAAMGTFVFWTATTTPANAQPSVSRYYQAELAAPVERTTTAIQNGVAWKCVGAACGAGEGNSRPEVVCARLARKVGPLVAFSANGKALDPAALARCNGDKDAPLARR